MRCKACDAEMSDEDVIRKFPADAEGARAYSDLCGKCFETSIEVLFDEYQEPENDYGLFYSTRTMPTMQE